MFYRPTLLALVFIVLPVVCDAEVITAYDLTGKAGNEFFDSATASAPHVNGEALLRGDGLTATAATNSFAASGWDDNSSRDYFTFSFFVAPGYQVTLTDLLISTRSSGTGPGSLWLYYNYTGTLDIIRDTFTQSGTTTLNSDVDLENLTVTGRATFTILRDPFGGSASGGAVAPSGTFRIANYTDPNTSVVSPISFLGTVSRIGESGDFNGNGMVDAGDYDVWRNAFGSSSQLAADGNDGGVVDAADYVLWRKNLSSPGAGSESSTSVPECGSLSLLVLGSLALFARRRAAPGVWGIAPVLFVLAVSLVVASANRAHADSAEAWGDNQYGQLGNGNNTDSKSPAAVTDFFSGVTALAGGGDYSMGIQNGGVYAWGHNVVGELGNGSNADSNTPQPVSGLSSDITAIAGGAAHGLAIQNGALYAWGQNFNGQLGNGNNTDSNVPAAVSGMFNNVTDVAAGYAHSLAIRNHLIYAWGYNANGELGNGSNDDSNVPVPVQHLSSGVTAIAAGGFHNLAIQNGGVHSWGKNDLGQLGAGFIADSNTPVPVSGMTSGVTAIAAGQDHSLAVKNGNVYSWGDNSEGQLGTGNTNGSHVAVRVDPTDLTNIVSVAAGGVSSYALSSDGSLWVWGDNEYGELGLGTTSIRYLTPQHLLPPSGYAFTSIAAGEASFHVLATLSSPAETGDFNGDGVVDAGDYDAWRNAFGSASQFAADGNGDGVVDAADYVVWRTHVSQVVGSGSGASVNVAVPEPSAMLLAALGGVAIIAAPRRTLAVRK